MYISGRLVKSKNHKENGMLYVRQFYSGYVYKAPLELVGIKMDRVTGEYLLLSDGSIEARIENALDHRVVRMPFAEAREFIDAKPKRGK